VKLKPSVWSQIKRRHIKVKTPEQIEAKIKEAEASKLQLIQQVSAHDGYLQALRDMLKDEPEEDSKKEPGLSAVK
jgi:hypothetical protein